MINNNLHAGHRKRLRERFLKDFGSSMADYEILELVLCLAIPRKDVKPIAKKLITKFIDLNGVISADIKQLQSKELALSENAISAIKLIYSCGVRGLQSQIKQATIISSWQHLLDYCKIVMGNEKAEQLRVFFLDSKNFLISDEVLSIGTVNKTSIFPREIARRAIELNAVSIILVHNHPSNDTTPSQNDIDMTMTVRELLKQLDITLHDHVIISKKGHYSFRSQGLIV